MKVHHLFCPVALAFFASGALYSSEPFKPHLFLSIEGGYNRNAIDGYNFNIESTSYSSKKVERGQAVRAAFGAMYPDFNDKFSIGSEFSWGYYGTTTLTPSFDIQALSFLRSVTTFTGFDFLLDTYYKINQKLNFSLKGGVFFGNSLTKLTLSTASDYITNGSIFINSPQIVPEIKLGLEYNLTNKIFLFSYYTYVFGDTFRISLSSPSAISTTAMNALFNINLRSPSFNMATLGIKYSFA